GIRDRNVTGVQTCALPIFAGDVRPPLEEGAGVHPRRGMALEEDLVAAAGMVLAAEEVVEPDLVEGGGSRVGGDVSAHGDVRSLRSEERRVGKEWRCGRWQW